MPQTDSVPAAATLPEAVRVDLESLIESGKLELPLLPDIAVRIISCCSDENCDIRALTNTIQSDPSMTGNVLRLANSALYGAKVQIVTLQQALSRLGLRMIQQMALIVSCENRVFRVPGYDEEVREMFWHALAAGLFAQEVARQRRWNVEEAFLCGLLHDVGRPVVIQALADLAKRHRVTLPKEAVLATATEHHTRVGSSVVASWQLPARLSETILYHHDPDAAPTAQQTAMMTRFCDDLAHLLMRSKDEITEDTMRAHPMLAPLNVYPEELEALLAARAVIRSKLEKMS